jgi:tripartite-type tricarboxylate transporter receptor subunit TctC
MRRSVAFALMTAAIPFGVASSLAQTYPSKTIRIVVPYPAGGGVDIAGRAIAPQLAANFGASVIVDNRPGAGGTVGTDHVAKAAPDGYTLLVSGRGPLAAAPLTNPNLPYVTARDIAAVGNLVTAPYILAAHPSVPAATARELIALAKTQPGRLNVVSGGAGGGQHIAAEEFNLLAGTRMTHVPYKAPRPQSPT